MITLKFSIKFVSANMCDCSQTMVILNDLWPIEEISITFKDLRSQFTECYFYVSQQLLMQSKWESFAFWFIPSYDQTWIPAICKFASEKRKIAISAAVTAVIKDEETLTMLSLIGANVNISHMQWFTSHFTAFDFQTIFKQILQQLPIIASA